MTKPERSKLINDFTNAALKLVESDAFVLEDRKLWEDVDKGVLIDSLRVQSALLRERTVELDGWTEAMRLIHEATETPPADSSSAFNEIYALLSPRVGSGKDLTVFSLLLMSLAAWREGNTPRQG